MKKIILVIACIFNLLFFAACTQVSYYTVSFEVDLNGEAQDYKAIVVKANEILDLSDVSFGGYKADKWYLNEEKTIELPEEYIITSNITLYASLSEQCKVTFINYDNTNTVVWVEKGTCVKEIILEDPDMEFLGWYDRSLTIEFDFLQAINSNTSLYAKWNAPEFIVEYDFGFECYANKTELYESFFTDYYYFLIENTDIDMAALNISSCDNFLEVCANWNAYGKDSFYGVGDMFKDYFVTIEIGGSVENQPTDTFIGYCYQNNKYRDFIEHLIVFFEYWRTDEGYTGGADDPNNLGNDFFAEPWASLVDTCKFFKFTSENLNDTYSWFRSERVKDALDNIPSVININVDKVGSKIDPVYLPTLNVRNGYNFVGWVDENGNSITTVNKAMKLTAVWEKVK